MKIIIYILFGFIIKLPDALHLFKIFIDRVDLFQMARRCEGEGSKFLGLLVFLISVAFWVCALLLWQYLTDNGYM